MRFQPRYRKRETATDRALRAEMARLRKKALRFEAEVREADVRFRRAFYFLFVGRPPKGLDERGDDEEE